MTEKVQRARRNRFIEFLREHKVKGRLLNIGCQDGDMCYMCHQKCFEKYGIDIDYELITRASTDRI